jgi:hypothetical protein
MSIVNRAYGAQALPALPQLDKVAKPETDLGESF